MTWEQMKKHSFIFVWEDNHTPSQSAKQVEVRGNEIPTSFVVCPDTLFGLKPGANQPHLTRKHRCWIGFTGHVHNYETTHISIYNLTNEHT